MRGLGLVVAAALAGTAVLLPAPAGQAAPVSSCTSSAGTVVAVDFAHWGGPVVRGCDTAEPQTGAELLTDSGFALSGTQHDGPAFICRIGNSAYRHGRQYPTVHQDPCVLTPPATAYWSYWLAAPGSNRWTYSNWGAYAEQSKPRPGGVELWIFGGTTTKGSTATPVNGFPVCAPNSLRAGGSPTRCTPRTVAAKRKHERERHASSTPSSSVPSRSSSAPRSSRPSATHAPRSTPVRTSSTAGVPPSAMFSRTSAQKRDTAVVDAEPTASTRPSSGSVVPVIVTFVLVAVLLGGGGAAMWRRRRGER